MATILSGIKPTGTPTLGNYLGGFKSFVRMQQENKDSLFLFFIADMHAITTEQNPVELRKNIINLASLYLACGLSLDNLYLFIQSEISEHLELGYVMQSISYMGELERMTQYKDKVSKQVGNITSALFTYPSLMAADILLYDAQLVPVGEDQKQHLELTRDLANRFNNRYKKIFTIPDPIIPKVGARIMDLQNPQRKMDKSNDDPKGCILLLDPINVSKKKIKIAITDNLGIVKYDPINQPGISNLMTIYSSITSLSFKEIEEKYNGLGYGSFKTDLSEIVGIELEVIQNKYHEIINSKTLDKVLDEGRDFAKKIASKKLQEIYQVMGLGRKKEEN